MNWPPHERQKESDVQTIRLQHPTRFRLPDGMNQGLQYYIHDEADALRFELAGSLSNGGAQSVYQAWQNALSILSDRATIIDISFVTDADAYGSALPRALASEWGADHRGVTPIASSGRADYQRSASRAVGEEELVPAAENSL